MNPGSRLILASASPRRRELLHEAGYEFQVHPAEVNEEDYPPAILPADLALHLARIKAETIAGQFTDDFVLAADTVVAFGDQILGKPHGEAHALQMLQLLSGTTHIVITGIALIRGVDHYLKTTRVMSCVRMRTLKDDEIKRYIATGDWQGKAGGYGIQDVDPFVTRVAGCHTNIVGLPMTSTRKLLDEAGVQRTR